MRITVDKNIKYQTFENFGASGAWWAQEVGGWDQIDEESSLPVFSRIAQLLYSKSDGIGLCVYRYNLGGGSKNSGSSVFANKNRAVESFDISDNEYDWNRDKNAVKMMKEAVKYGADQVILFSNSPPERWTKNHKSCLDKPWRTNLDKANEQKFAEYLVDCAEHFVSENIPVKYISPVNEPLWVWTEKHGQEGCHYRPSGVRRILHKTAVELEKRNTLKNVKLAGAENGDIRWFNKSYTRAILDDPVIRRNLDSVDNHSYFAHIPVLHFLNNRIVYLKRYRKWIDKKYPGVNLKTSEWTHMQGGRDSGMDSAIVTAETIFDDITVLNVTSWQHWIAVSEVDYCDGLIYINESKKTFETTKRLYVTGNFSKYIPENSVRIKAQCDDGDIKVSSFLKYDKIVTVLINPTENEKSLSIDSEKIVFAVTDKTHDLFESKIKCQKEIIIPEKSICTIISEGGI